MIDASKLDQYVPVAQRVTNTPEETIALGRAFAPLISIFNRAAFSDKPVIKIGLVGIPDIGKTQLVEGLLEGYEKSDNSQYKIYEDRVDYDVRKDDNRLKTVTAKFFYSVNHGWLLQYDAGLDEDTLLELELVDGFMPYEMDYLNTILKGQPGVVVFEHANAEKLDRQGFDMVFKCHAENRDEKTGRHSLVTDIYMTDDLVQRIERTGLEY